MIWNPKYECMPKKDLAQLQKERLQQVVSRIYQNVPFYRKKLSNLGIKPEDIRSLEDMLRLPFTTKQDLRDNYPFQMFAVPLENVIRIHSSSGTTGKPIVVGYTRQDIEIWSEVMARTLTCAGTVKGDRVHVAYGYGLFTGGLGTHYGAEKIGACVIPVSAGNTKRQVMIMKDWGSTILASTPSYALYLAEVAEEMGFDTRKDFQFRAGVFGAEPWSDNMRREIEQRWSMSAFDIYGLSEIIGPGVASECPLKNGLHIFEDHFLPEVIDHQTGEVLPYGEKGELVFTTLTKEALPLIRYRTGDIAFLNPEPCACGRGLVRMSKVMGRTDDMIIIRGVNVFPSQIESIIMRMEGAQPHYLLVVTREGALDELEVWVEVSESVFSDKAGKLSQLEQKILDEIESLLGLTVKVKLVEPKTIERSEGKTRRVLDKRKI